jgi:hypothetical protein
VADLIELEARISALEMILTTQLLQSGVSTPGFDPTAFAMSRRDAWLEVGEAVCANCETEPDEQKFAEAYAAALGRMGHLLVALAEPVQEAVNEMADGGGNSLEDASREAVQDMEQRSSAGAPHAGAGDIG